MTTHSSILVWRIPWKQEPGKMHSMGSQRVRHDWSDLAGTHTNTSTVLPKKNNLNCKTERIKLFLSDLTASQREKKMHMHIYRNIKISSIQPNKIDNVWHTTPKLQNMQWSRKKKKRNEMKQEKSQWIKAETEMKQMIQ